MVYIQLPAKLNFEGYYSETCLNPTSLGTTFVFGIDSLLVYTG